MTDKFYFYITYADITGDLTDVQAGIFIKKMCRFFFADEEFNPNSTDRVTGILLLLKDELEEQKENSPPYRKRCASFTFRSVYANIFYSLKDAQAGLLIKKICDYRFGGNRVNGKDTAAIDRYFDMLKNDITKSANRAANSRRRHYTLEKIYRDFPYIAGKLPRWDEALTGVSMRELYEFIASDRAVQSENMSDILLMFKDHKCWQEYEDDRGGKHD